MHQTTLDELSHKLTQDERAGFQEFRQCFFAALERRQLDRCQALLDVLKTIPSPYLQRDYRYHQAVLYSELRQMDRAEQILRNLLADDLAPEQRARVLLALAIQFDEQGLWSDAETYYQAALTAYAATGDELGRAKTYNNLGISISFQVELGASQPERLSEAIRYHQRALDVTRAVDNPWEIAKNWHGLGMAYGLMRSYHAALDAFQRHVALCEELDDPADQAVGLSDMAALAYLPLGQLDEAAAALDSAIAIFHEHSDPLHLAEALARRGNLLAAQNRPEEALHDYESALALTESIRARLTAPTTQAQYRTTVEAIYKAPLSLHLQRNEAERAFNATERARSRVLADLLAGQSAHPHTEIPTNLIEQRDALRQKLDQAYADADMAVDLPQWEAKLADLDRQIELLDPTYAALATVAPLTIGEVQSRLPADAAVVTYVSDASDRFWILVVTPADVHMHPVPGISVRWLQAHLVEHLDGVRRGSVVPEPRSGFLAPPRLFVDLYKILIEPIWELLAPRLTVYFVPAGPLHYVPLGALTPDLSYSPPLLASGRRIVYAPSATVLLNYCHTRPPSSHQGIVAIAPTDGKLQYIQGAAKTIAYRGGTSVAGSAATRRALLTRARHHRVLCFLGHALFDRRYPMSSRLQLADGSLHASELLRELRLQADLVILAACESGRGRVLRGDEILGLSRAMLYAGTPSLLVTLWPVLEIPTRLFIERFVDALSREDASSTTIEPARALTVTQNWLRTLPLAAAQERMAEWDELSNSEIVQHLTHLWHMTHPGEELHSDSQIFNHPYFWSPYILIGDRHRDH